MTVFVFGSGQWQQALAAEHAAVFGYSLLGPRLAAGDQPAARACEQAHRDSRDRATAVVLRTDAVPVQSLADYPLAFPITGPTAARRLALRLEESVAAAWRYLIATPSAASDPPLRAIAQRELTACAVRAVRWRRLVDPAAPSVPFPGI